MKGKKVSQCVQCGKFYRKDSGYRKKICKNCDSKNRNAHKKDWIREKRILNPTPKKERKSIEKPKAIKKNNSKYKTIFIYILKDDQDNIRYVGKSVNPYTRLTNHIYEATHPENSVSPNLHKNRWVRKLISEDKKPILEIVEEVDYEIGDEREIYWIRFYKDSGIKLTNMTDGGSSLPEWFEKKHVVGDQTLARVKFQLFSKVKSALLWGIRNYVETVNGTSLRKFGIDSEIDMNGHKFVVRNYIEKIQKLGYGDIFSDLNEDDIDEILYEFEDESVPVEFLMSISDRIFEELQ